MKKLITVFLAAAATSALFIGQTSAQPRADRCWPGTPSIEHVKDDLYVIFGESGNVGMSAGDEGIFLIDDQTKPLTEALLEMIASVHDGEVKFVLNTHHHGDHTGGNENLGEKGVVIVAHDNLRARLVEEGQFVKGLPVITFNDSASIFLNGHEARAMHTPNAHTDGDSVVFFKDQNVVHMGDVMFNTCYPYIDTNSGGTVDGVLNAVNTVMEKIDGETIVIPGHGPVTDKAGLMAYRNMLQTLRDRVAALKSEGKSLDEVVAAGVSSEYDGEWTWGFIGPERIITAIYNSLP